MYAFCALKRPENTHRIFFFFFKLCELCVKKPWYALSYKFMCIYISKPHIFGYQTSRKFCRIFSPAEGRGPCWSWRLNCCFCVQCTASEFILEVHPRRSVSPDLSHRRSFSVFHAIPKGTGNKWGTVGNRKLSGKVNQSQTLGNSSTDQAPAFHSYNHSYYKLLY